MGARRSAPPGLDYVPVPGNDPNVVFGVIRANLAGVPNSAMQAVCRRMFPVTRPKDPHAPWARPTCFHSEAVVPDWAPSDYWDPQALCRAYDQQAWDGLKDLVIHASFRFPETVSNPPSLTLQASYELVRSFARRRFVEDRNLPVVLAMHVPGRAGQDGLPPHVHVLVFCRELGPTGFGAFAARPLATDAGRAMIEDEWHAWRDEARGE